MQETNPYDAPEESTAADFAGGSRTLHVKSIDALSAGKLLGTLYALLGLIVGAFMSLIALLGAAVGGDAALGRFVGGVGAIVIIPILYGVMGFIGGLIGALLYNVVAGMVGGIRFDVD